PTDIIPVPLLVVGDGADGTHTEGERLLFDRGVSDPNLLLAFDWNGEFAWGFRGVRARAFRFHVRHFGHLLALPGVIMRRYRAFLRDRNEIHPADGTFGL